MEIVVQSVIELSKSQKQTLQESLEKLFDSFQVEYRLNPKLVGGLKITIGSKQLDLSIKNKLNQIQTNLT